MAPAFCRCRWQPQPLGHTPEEGASDFKIFSLDVRPADVPNNAYLQIPYEAPRDIADGLREPTFFKAVVPIEDSATVAKLVATETALIKQERDQLAQIDAQIQTLSEKELRGKLDADERAALDRAQRKRGEIVPNWLLFDSRRDLQTTDVPAEELAARSKPTVPLRYDNHVPFLVERAIGRGRVLLFTSGFLSNWNDFERKDAFWLMDRILRSRIESTLPERNVNTSSKPIVVPISATQRNEQFYSIRPDNKEQLLEVERIGRDEFGVAVSDFSQRGVYRVAMRGVEQRGRPGGRLAQRPAGKPRGHGHGNRRTETPRGVDRRQRPARRIEAGRHRRKRRRGQIENRRSRRSVAVALGCARRGDQSDRRRSLGARHLVVADLVGALLLVRGIDDPGLALVRRSAGEHLMFAHFIGWLMGVENLQSIDSVRVSLAAPSAQHGPAWVVFGVAALAIVAALFYARCQPTARRGWVGVLAVSRAVLLIALFLILADPVLKMELTSRPRPLLYVVFDGTESMEIQDEMPDAERARLAKAVGLTIDNGSTEPAPAGADKSGAAALSPTARLSRMEYVKALVNKKDDNLFSRLESQCRIEPFILERPDGVRKLNGAETPQTTVNGKLLSDQLTTKGQLTALGTAFDDLAEHYATSHLAGVIMFSDFGNNSGPAPAGTATSPVKKLGVPVYAVGIGPQVAVDLATEIELPRQLKKAERQEVKVVLRQSGLDGRRTKITVTARRKAGPSDSEGEIIQIGQRDVTLIGPTVEERVRLRAAADRPIRFPRRRQPHGGPSGRSGKSRPARGNRGQRFSPADVCRIRADLGMAVHQGSFSSRSVGGDARASARFLRSSDPKVRTTNPLFLPTLTPKRSDFLANDVIFLGDMPATALGERFCELANEFVTQFGGGLVVIAGPRFGPGQLEGTKLADILPVVVDSNAHLRDDHPFRMELTPDSHQLQIHATGRRGSGRCRQPPGPGTIWGCCPGISPSSGSIRWPPCWPSIRPT